MRMSVEHDLLNGHDNFMMLTKHLGYQLEKFKLSSRWTQHFSGVTTSSTGNSTQRDTQACISVNKNVEQEDSLETEWALFFVLSPKNINTTLNRSENLNKFI